SDIDTAQVNSLKVLDPEWPTRQTGAGRPPKWLYGMRSAPPTPANFTVIGTAPGENRATAGLTARAGIEQQQPTSLAISVISNAAPMNGVGVNPEPGEHMRRREFITLLGGARQQTTTLSGSNQKMYARSNHYQRSSPSP